MAGLIISQTPLRISFLGGNTDFPEYFEKFGGMVLTTTIDKYIYCIVNKRFDDDIRINYSVKEIVQNVDDIKHELVRESMRKLGITKGIEITFLSDIPSEGSGLGSSSSVLVGLLNALHRYKGEYMPLDMLAREACEIEIDILKKPIGVQDQYIAALGGLREIVFPYGVGRIDLPIPLLDELNNSLMLFFTGITRKSSDVLSKMKEDKEILAQNVVLAIEGTEAIKAGDMKKLGELLSEYWELKKRLNPSVTNMEIDEMYKKAMDFGAYGGKIAGAGGGGFLLLVVPSNKRQEIRIGMANYKELPFKLEYDGSKIIFDTRRY